MRTVKLPKEGVYRAGRWQDVENFPEPVPAIALPFTAPLYDGPRWEDVNAGFATVKCSRSAEAAIGRTIARYRRRMIPPSLEGAQSIGHASPRAWGTTEGGGLIDAIKHSLSGRPDKGEPRLVEGTVPPDVLTDLYLLHIPGNLTVNFVDLDHESTLATLKQLIGNSLSRLGLRSLDDSNLARERDRRLTRLVLRALHEICADKDVAGVRIPGQPDEAWESYIIWSKPPVVDLARDSDELRWVAPVDPALIKAANTLGLRLPYEPSPTKSRNQSL